MKTIIFPGSFDPFTIGHKDVVERILPLFDKVVIAFGVNLQKKSFMPLEERMERVRKAFAGNDKIEVTSYTGLTVDLAKKYDTHYILRGVRTNADFEYERIMADANRRLEGVDTIFVVADEKYAYVSSSLVRELSAFGRDITDLIV